MEINVKVFDIVKSYLGYLQGKFGTEFKDMQAFQIVEDEKGDNISVSTDMGWQNYYISFRDEKITPLVSKVMVPKSSVWGMVDGKYANTFDR